MTSPFQESEGVESSKRWIGSVLCAAGCSILIPLGWVSISGPPAVDPQTALSCASALIVPGVGLLASTVVESFAPKAGQ
jgi:hypothetical protein